MDERGVGVDHQRRHHHRVDVDRAGRLAHQRDLGRVATERGDVGVDELQRLDDVEDREVARVVLRVAGLQLRHVEEAEHAEPVVDRDDDGVRRARQVGAVVHRVGGIAGDVAAAVHPDDDGQRPGRARRLPDVEIEAVFRAERLAERRADRRVVAVVRARAVQAARLDAGVAEFLRRDGRPPGIGIDRRRPAQRRRPAAWRTERPSSCRCRSSPTRWCRRRRRTRCCAAPAAGCRRLRRRRSIPGQRRGRRRRRRCEGCRSWCLLGQAFRAPAFDVPGVYRPATGAIPGVAASQPL